METKNKKLWAGLFSTLLACICLSPSFSMAEIYDVILDGTDAIYLAGRDDVTVPALDYDFFDGEGDLILKRHNYGSVPADFEIETFPVLVPVTAGDVVRVMDTAEGWIHFYNGLGSPATGFGPEGNMIQSVLNPLEGLSGWHGPQGSLAGVFLDDSNPNEQSPLATLDFWSVGTRDFVSLSPALSQVFFIGDGVNNLGDFQEFIAPSGATRLFLGIPDGFGFFGSPGAYEDNDGEYRILIGVNQIPAFEIPVSVDIKPGSCPNPVNTNSKGVVSVAIVGTEDFDVTTIDPTSVLLAGVYPLRWSYEDVATPYELFLGEDCYDCHELEGDGYTDIVFHFNKGEFVAALGEVSDGDCLVVTLTGNLFEDFGGSPIVGEDVVLIIKN